MLTNKEFVSITNTTNAIKTIVNGASNPDRSEQMRRLDSPLGGSMSVFILLPSITMIHNNAPGVFKPSLVSSN